MTFDVSRDPCFSPSVVPSPRRLAYAGDCKTEVAHHSSADLGVHNITKLN